MPDIQEDVLAAMAAANLPPEFSYAYRKTGLLGLRADKSAWPPEHIQEWNDAVDEYRAMQAASQRPGRPDPREWTTNIPELSLAPFTKDDLAQVKECLQAIAEIESRGVKVVTRIELAAALMTSACAHAYCAGEEDGEMAGGDLYARTEQVIVQRAREIYAQGGAGLDETQ